MKPIAAVLLAASLPAPLWAQSLGAVVVTASRLEQRIQDALPNTTLITREDIDRAQTPDLPTLLRQLGGMEIGQNGGSGTLASAFVRGAESRHTLVLIDGVAINNLNFSTVALEHLPLGNVERIEIVRGNVSSLYGSSALGGVIQIFTREAVGKPQVSLTLQAGSRGLVEGQASAGVKLATGTRLTATAETLSDTGFNAIDQAKRAGTNPDTDGYRRRAVSFGVAQDLGEGPNAAKVAFMVREASGVTAYDSQFGPSTQADESRFAERSAALTGEFVLSDGLMVNAGITRSSDKLDADVTAYPYYVNSFSDGALLGVRWKVAPQQNVTAGVESVRQRIESDTTYNASSRQLDSSRVGYQGDFGDHLLQLNARQDQYSDFGTASTWYAGYGYRFAPDWRVNASASTGFNAPTFNDLYYPFGGNAALRPERLNSSEWGLQYATRGLEVRAVWFSNRFTDLIGNDANFNRVNVAEARNEGLEVSASGHKGGLQLRGGLTAQDPRDVTANKPLKLRAKLLANLGVSADAGPWAYGANLRYSGERTDGAKTLDSYAVLDLQLSHALSPELKLFGRLENALDARYETVYGYNQPSRGVFVGITWQPRR